MPRCEDYPCCGHGQSPQGDGGGCPDEQGRFNCVTCGRKLPRGASSSICLTCRKRQSRRGYDEDLTGQDSCLEGIGD